MIDYIDYNDIDYNMDMDVVHEAARQMYDY